MSTRQRRYAKACDACWGKKVKCDFDGKSCNLCRKNGDSTCVFTKIEKGQRKKAQRRNDLSALEDRLRDMEALLKGPQAQAAQPSIPARTVHEDTPPDSNSSVEAPSPCDDQSEQCRLPRKEVATLLVQGYLASCNMLFPIFNPNTVLLRLEQEWPPRKEVDITWHTTILIILGFAHRLRAMSDPATSDIENREAGRYLGEALDIAPMLAYSKPSLATVQVLLGISNLLRSTAMPDPARMFLSSAIRILQDLDAHKEPPSNASHSWLVNELGRVFWVAYIADKGLASHTGKPPVLYEEDISRRPPVSSESWGIVRSLDYSFQVDFFVAAYRMAAIQGLVWKRVQSATAVRTSVELSKVQAELNPVLAAWNNDFPFSFKRDALVGRWPKSSVLYVIMFHFQYFQVLLELNREPEGAPVPLDSDPTVAECLTTNTYSTAPLVVQAARESLDLAGLAPKGNFAHIWLFFDYKVSAILTLLVNMLVRPIDACANLDLQRVEEWLPVTISIADSSGRPDLLRKKDLLVRMRSSALRHAQGLLDESLQRSATSTLLDGQIGLDPATLLDGTSNDISADVFPFDQWNWIQEDEPVLPIWRW